MSTNKIKTTSKQRDILDALKGSREMLTASRLKEKLPNIDSVTIYRNLDKFSKAGLLRKTLSAHGEAMYEYIKDKHYHTACNDCEKVSHIELPSGLLDKIPALKHFRRESIEITIRGGCK